MSEGSGLKKFFELLIEVRRAALHVSTWRADLGDDTCDALVRASVLVEADRADWYPCGGASVAGCPRRVADRRAEACGVLVARCGAKKEKWSCLDVEIVEADLATWRLDEQGFLRALRKAFGIGGFVEAKAGFLETVALGESSWRGGQRRAVLAYRPELTGFDLFLSALEARGPHVVFVPRTRWIAGDLLLRHSSGHRVEVIGLDEVLEIEEGRVAPRRGDNLWIAEEKAKYAKASYVLRDHEGERAIGLAERTALRERVGDFDFFLDMTESREGRYEAHSRSLAGTSRVEPLSANEASVLVALMLAGHPMRAAQLCAALGTELQDPAKLVERARRKVDYEVTGAGWRLFSTLKMPTKEAKEFAFTPARGVTFALVRSA